MSHTPGTATTAPVDPSTSRDSPDLARMLGTIAAEMASAGGFRVSAVSLFRASDELEFVVVDGDDDAAADLTGDITPTPVAMTMLERAERWGPLRFLPHHEAVELLDHIWVGSAEGDGADAHPDAHPDAWQPCDLLMAPLTDAEGALQGIVWVDLPHDGRRPGPEQRRRLAEHAERANRAMVQALEHERLREQVRLADAARRVVRTATADLDLARLVQTTIDSVCDGFAVDEVRVHLLAEEDVADLDELSLQSRLLAERCWRDQQVAIVSHRRAAPALLSAEEHAVLLDGLHEQGDASLLLTPLGAGPECVGRLLMFRHDRADWSDEEASAALDIGHDLGRAVLNARSFEREQQAAAYRQQLIATMAHELKNPLAAVGGYLDMLEMFLAEEPGTGTQVQRSLRGIGRATRRLDDIVADLLTLARFDEAADPASLEPHDLGVLLHDVVDGLAVQADARGIRVQVHLPSQQALVDADPSDLERLVVNLVSNAVKYSHDGGEVDVHLEAAPPTVVLRVVDRGIGIDPAEQQRLFEEFYRSADPAAASQSGTGLGLAIVHRVVHHLGGRIDVESAPGEGSVFTVTLPGSRV
ncbi:GAF domain-containing sensor histidine kinase [Nocardioides sp. 31GB23]|uniref:sensor histidine kinase n=1 Tax=Nocardioides sp. 31GB23 TaxID=3156065 RepID=UPI0032AFBE02